MEGKVFVKNKESLVYSWALEALERPACPQRLRKQGQSVWL
jgi:hypothetical protein